MTSINKHFVLIVIVAVLLVAISVVGLEEILFPNRVNAKNIKSSYAIAVTAGLMEGGRLQERIPQPWDGAYVLKKPVLLNFNSSDETQSVVSDEEDARDYITVRLSGIMKAVDQTFQAVLNRSLVKVGSRVGACEVVEITGDYVELKVGTELQRLHLNEERRFRRVAFENLALEDIINEGTVWRAQINGQIYRAGDWVDSETQIRAITPNQVLVVRAGTSIALKRK